MVIPSDPFYQLLEHYLFGAASKFIDLARPEEQNKLIGLIGLVSADIGSLAGEAGPALGKGRGEPPALIEPADSMSVDEPWLIAYIQKRLQRQQAYMCHIEKAIHTTETLYEHIDSRFYAEPARSTMLERNKRILGLYQQHLATVKMNQDTLRYRLSKLTSQADSSRK